MNFLLKSTNSIEDDKVCTDDHHHLKERRKKKIIKQSSKELSFIHNTIGIEMVGVLHSSAFGSILLKAISEKLLKTSIYKVLFVEPKEIFILRQKFKNRG